jgi:hypothetical protein
MSVLMEINAVGRGRMNGIISSMHRSIIDPFSSGLCFRVVSH